MYIPIVSRFTCSESQLLNTIKRMNNQNFRVIIDYSNENCKMHKQNFEKIKNLTYNYNNQYIALKLSSLNIQNDCYYAENKAFELCEKAIANDNKIFIDAENFLIQDNISKISNKLMKHFNKRKVNVYKTYQMYKKNSFEELNQDLNLERDYLIGVKLVRGAYYNQDKQFNILHKHIEDTHYNYNKAITYFNSNSDYNDKLMIATHNKNSVLLGLHQNNKNIEFSQLMGMSDNLSKMITKDGGICYKYIPIGNIFDTIPYLLRRLYENPSMFFNITK